MLIYIVLNILPKNISYIQYHIYILFNINKNIFIFFSIPISFSFYFNIYLNYYQISIKNPYIKYKLLI